MAFVGDEPFVSPSPNFRRAVEERSIEWEDYSNFGATLRFVAGALGVPFMRAHYSEGEIQVII